MDGLLKKKLTRILRSDDFDALIKLYDDIVTKWDQQSVVGKNTYETLKLLFIKEGKKQGLKEFFDFLENQE